MIPGPKKKPQTIAADTGLSKKHTSKFTGTDNPRHLRIIAALLVRPRRREDVDSIAGASNGPDLIAELRRRGLTKEKHLPCDRVPFVDRDGKPCQPGVYHLTPAGKRLIRDWQLRIKEAREVGHE
jgi:hypothetical protein